MCLSILISEKLTSGDKRRIFLLRRLPLQRAMNTTLTICHILCETSKNLGRVHNISKGQLGEIPIVGHAAANDCV